MQSDPIADLLTRIRNASTAKKHHVDVKGSKMVHGIVEILKEEGFIAHFLSKEENSQEIMRLFLKYDDKSRPIINGVKRTSTPGLRKYAGSKEIPSILKGLGISIVSTSAGVITGKKARESNVGGELLCLVW